ncbi:MAG: hypothetical protein NC082_02415 [Clostridiales bacterium]|nr:hypothetical protein [Clostridiales bacterium]
MKIRRYIHTIITLMAVLLSSNSMTTVAAGSVGQWKLYGSYSTIDDMVETSRGVYYVSNGQLYRYNQDDDEIYNLSIGNKLSDSNVKSLYYNIGTEQLIVVYENGNIDVIEADGKVFNMPDLKDAVLDVLPTVNDVDFDGDRMYVATNFGVVIFDTDRKEVVTSGIYNKNITSISKQGDTLWAVENYIYYTIDLTKSITPASALQRASWGYTTDDLKTAANGWLVILGNQSRALQMYDVKVGGDPISTGTYEAKHFSDLQILRDGTLMCRSESHIYLISPEGTVKKISVKDTDLETLPVAGTYDNKKIASLGSIDCVWVEDTDGLSSYSIKDGSVEQLTTPAKPQNQLSLVNIGRLNHAPSGAIYAFNYGPTILYDGANEEDNERGWFNLFHVNKIVDGEVTDMTPIEYSVTNKNNRPYDQSPVGFKSGTIVRENPRDPEAYALGSYWDGVYYVKDRKEVVHYDATNSTLRPFGNNFRMHVNGLDFDRQGNMWVVLYDDDGDNTVNRQYHMLQADKVGHPTTEADWQVYPLVTPSEHDGKLMACHHSNNIFYIDSYYKGPVNVIKTKGTTTISDDIVISVTDFIDQDGIMFSYQNLYSVVEDKLGRVWVGTDNGVFEITRPDEISSTTIKVNHLKVPRRDGTNYADYLLNGEKIYDIAIDPSNRKWIATALSGVYLVSENGDEILQHFDKDNSPLPSNSVYSVACGNGNDVYFGTAYGLCEYSSDSSPAGEDYSDVYAYPNPVRPDYTGMITVTGLMENSLVKIADAAGNVVFQDISNGGMLTWDGCDRHGNRVKTGVYYVFASQRDGGSSGSGSNAAVTKIMVIN